MMTPPILILAIGNESRGDDAIAPLLLRQFGEWLEKEELAGQFELLEDFQLQVEHAADLDGRDQVLFIDAGMDTPDPLNFYRTHANNSPTAFSHAITPDAVLATYTQVYRKTPPPAFVLCVRGDSFELGEPLSPKAEKRMTSAMKLLHELAQNTKASHWEKCASAN